MKKLFTIEIPESRNFGLDLLRFFAIFFVLINHGSYQLSLPLKKINSFLYLDGVLLFFVLSGFLIGGIFIRTYEKNNLSKTVFKFWIRRWMRTLPAYFFVLTIVCILHFITYNELDSFKTLNHFLFIQNFTEFDSYLYPEAWSLSIEEWFYLLLPIFTLISFFFIKNKEKAFLLVIIFFLIVCPILRLIRFYNYPISNNISEWDKVFRSVTLLRLDSIMFGVLAAFLRHYYGQIFFHLKKLKLFIGILILISLRIFDLTISYSTLFQTVFSFSLNSFGVFLTLPFLFEMKLPKSKLIITGVTFTSLISYSLYLVNSTPLQALFLNRIGFEKPFYIKYLSFWILSFMIATLIYKFVELPFMKLRDKHFK
ncbi:MAG: acyltransferase [Chryseobacterium sp.]|jgi:peptidoglycan/LPS O-acetylase OafA/YrhL|nr:acyltransferase [Chryseobacterium sp.]